MATEKCPNCGAELKPEILDGLCPKCVLEQAVAAVRQPESVAPASPGPAEPTGLPDQSRTQATPIGVGSVLRYIGDYELLEEIARGGMGVVYKARQLGLNRPVALKMILAGQLATAAEVKRFHTEAEAAANLDHPNIVAIYEVGAHQGQHYFSMRLVEGQNLHQQMARYTQDLRAAAHLVAIVARAIHHAHQHGILHRDIKPRNILVDAKGEPHVTDFGLAKRVDLPSDLTRSETLMGTPDYMSPEQAQGRNKELTPATDIWSLGAVLYHLLAGQAPFHKETAWETIQAVVNEEPARPSALNHGVDRDLETICLKCLEKEPPRRYASAEALADDLERWLRGEPILARPSGKFQRAVKWARRKPVVASLTAAVVMVAAIGLAGWQVARHNAHKAIKATEEAGDILQANHELLIQQARADTNNLRGQLLLPALEEAVKTQPTNIALWEAKATVLERTNRLAEAVTALSSAIDLADESVSGSELVPVLLRRSRLLHEMGRHQEADLDYVQAGQIQCRRCNLPLRDPQISSNMLDLSPFLGMTLSSWLTAVGVKNSEVASTIAEEVSRATGVDFDLRSIMHLGGSEDLRRHGRPGPPESITGIAVNRRFARLLVLHSVWDREREGAAVGTFTLHYADGRTNALPILYGRDVRDIWRRDGGRPTRARIAWQPREGSTNSHWVQFLLPANELWVFLSLFLEKTPGLRQRGKTSRAAAGEPQARAALRLKFL